MSGSAPVLQMEMRHRQGSLTLDVSFSLTRPWTVLFGPSGSGKTTLLRAIQGLVRPDLGRILVGSECVLDTAKGVFVPAHLRAVRSAGQAARLFLGMTVGENLHYGLVSAGDGESAVVEEVLRICRIEGLATKLPAALSGGERQRVSVARAAVSAATNGGTLLLLDEPFAGLDFALRDALAVELQAWLMERKTPVLSVTHDVGEAFLLGAEVLRLEDGRIAEQGPVGTVLAAERERLLGQLRG